MSCDRLLLAAILSLIFLQAVKAQQNMLVDISANLTSIDDCQLNVIPVALNSVSIKLQNNLDVTIIDEQEPASIGLNVSNQILLLGSSFVGSIRFEAQFSYDLCECQGFDAGGCPNLSGSFIDETIPINFNGTCLINSSIYSHNGANFTLSYSFRVAMGSPEVTPTTPYCNTTSVNLQVNNTAPLYNWQVLNPLGSWVTFRGNASNTIIATRQELQIAAGNGDYENRNVRVVEAGCLTNRAGPSSEVFNFHVPAPNISFTTTPQTCHNSLDGSVAVTVTSGSPLLINDFIFRIHNPDNPVDPETGYSPAIEEVLFENSSNYTFQNLGVVGDAPKEYYITVGNNTNNKTYGSCISFSSVFPINNRLPINTTFTSSVKYSGHHISCNGGNDGQLAIQPSGGAGNYHSFSWNNGATTQNITNLSAGNYSVSYRDGNGCFSSPANIELTQPPALSVSIQSNNKDLYNNFDVSCQGAFNGYITASASGGVNGKIYQWNDGNTGSNYSGLGVGTYAVTVTDGNGCIADSDITLTAPPPITFSITEVAGIDCPDSATGSLTVYDVHILNEIGEVTFMWSNSLTTNTIHNLVAGEYNVTITDSQGCTGFAELNLNNPEPYTVSITPLSDYDGDFISCYGATDGILGAYLFDEDDNSAPGSFNWYKDEVSVGSGSIINNLNEGNYTVVVDYGNNCTAEETYFLEYPEPYTVNITPQSDYNGNYISCSGAADGILNATLLNADLTPVVGAFSWFKDEVAAGVGAIINNLNEGSYRVETVYGNNCTAEDTYFLEDPEPYTVSITPQSDYDGDYISCSSSADGILSATLLNTDLIPVVGSFSWYKDELAAGVGATINNLNEGNYRVEAVYGNNCTSEDTYLLEAPESYTVSITPQSDYNGDYISCSNATDGILSATLLNAELNPVSGSFSWYKDEVAAGVGATINNLNEGNYRVEAVYGNNCTAEYTYFLEAPEPYTVSITPQSDYDGSYISCSGAADGILSAILLNAELNPVSGSFSWYKDEVAAGVGETVNNLNEGNYRVEAIYGNNCTAEDVYFLEAPEPYTVSITPQSDYYGSYISCSGAADGILSAILLNADLNPVSDSFSWYKDEVAAGVGATIYNLNEGNYTVAAIYGNNCVAEDAYFLDDPEPYVVSVSIQSSYNGEVISCYGASDGALEVVLFDEHGNDAEVEYYAWSRNGVSIAAGENLNNIINLNEGEYSVETMYSNGCVYNGNITLIAPDPIVVQIQPDSDFNGYVISCVGENNGALLATASGGTTGTYTYVWDTGTEEARLTNVGTGEYTVTATDINNCPALSHFIIEDPPALNAFIDITSDFSGLPISCTGQSDGALLATATGGTDNYAFQWSTGMNNDALIDISAGEYEVTVTDENGCTAHANLSLADPPPVEVSISVISNYNGQAITCADEANGRLEALASGGTSNFSYSWSIGTLGSVQNNLTAGLYEVLATDENGCQANAQQELIEPEPVLASVVNISNFNGSSVSCANSLDGFIEVEGTGGTGVFSFNWTDHTETTNLISNIGLGLYTVIITDSNGCSAEVSQHITEPAPLNLAVISKNDVTCFGGNNGSIAIQANGGVAEYTFAINLAESVNESVFSLLTAGDYTLHVYDANNCYATISETLLQPSQIEINFEDIEPAFCDDPRGSASAIVSGGVMSYTYQWRNNLDVVIDENSNIENLAAGLYSLHIIDGNNCDASKFLGIQATDGPVVIVEEINNAKCSYSSDGSITMEVIEGDGPFTFQWQDGQNLPSATNLAQGEYFVMVQDANNCQTVSSGMVSAPSPLAISLLELKPPSCYGYSDGSIEVLGSGGTAPYAYDWGIFQGSLFPGRSKGNSYLTLYDANQCTTQASYSMPEPTPLSLSLISRILPKCYGECNGQIQVIAAGGNGAYVYNWDSGSELAIATNLCSDIHTVSVQDAKGCTLQTTYTLGQPIQLTPRLLVLAPPHCYNGCDGRLEVDATGGVGDYSYQWSDGTITPTAENLCSGTYTVTIQDANECVTQQIHQLLNPEQLIIELGESKTICEGQSHILNVGGIWSNYQWNSNVNFQSNATQVTINTAGQYWLTVTNALGCVARDTFLLTKSTDLLEASFIMPDQANVQDTIVMIDITWPLAESISWQLPPELVLLQDLNEVIYGKFLHAGTYTIGMHAQLRGCHDEVTKTISILGATALTEEELLGYEEFVKTFEVYPNPTQGNFTIALQFAEESFATLSVWEVLTGKVVKKISLEEDQDFSVNVDLHPLPPGAYVLRMDYRGGVKYLRFVIN